MPKSSGLRQAYAVVLLSQRRAGCHERGCVITVDEEGEGLRVRHHYAGRQPYVSPHFAQTNPDLAVRRLAEAWSWAHRRMDHYADQLRLRMARTGLEWYDQAVAREAA